MVGRPVSRFAMRADEISRGQLDVPELPVRGREEISTLEAAFHRMYHSVKAAMNARGRARSCRRTPPGRAREEEP
jgi:nitrogen fixation/metabolism regulation signal transduction histidine kinase